MSSTQPTPDEAEVKLIDVCAVATMLSCSVRHTYRLADAGRMPPPLKMGSLVRWSRKSIEERRDTKTQNPNGRCVSVSLCKVGPQDERIRAAIQRTLPPHIGRRDKMIFEFCRELRAIPEFADADPATLEPFVRQWYEAAEPKIGTKEFAVAIGAFLHGWVNVKIPKGETAVAGAYQNAKIADMSCIPGCIDHPSLRILIEMCRELQSMHGNRPFFLACCTLEPLFNVTHVTTWGWLNTLVQLKVLEKVSIGSMKTRKTNEYRFILNSQPKVH